MQVFSRLDRRRVPGDTRCEATSWQRLARPEPGALEEVVDRHVDAAFRVAHTIVHDTDRTADVLLAAFVALPAVAQSGPTRSVRVELLDTVRRLAASTVVAPTTAGVEPTPTCRPADVYRQLPTEVRDVLALAVAGRCDCDEIASIMGIGVATVRRDITIGLRHAATRLAHPAPQ